MDKAPKPTHPRRKKPPTSAANGPQPGVVPDAGVDPERREKIEKIKRALADGTYRIPDEDVARKVIEHMREPKS